ncbi:MULTISPECIES: DUF5820 family protein [Haloferax]|uniref:Uncharacterized protein n=2 Tax=Haloferax TaxID=2251 RepID=A0A6G1Z2J2_9EURY|nr:MULTISPECIES: DUF5820 family protein [Haloferax]KAB1188168.1 hypothetical protein Hfx1149_09045 [Haloferax sp. CBA1149]MRW80847.1 hypothetical protein [Haloferax marinisediminis]
MTDLPDGWTLWNDEPEGRRILAYRPDVFNESSFPAECMPTIFVWNGSRAKRPGASQIRTDTWHAVLYMEPEIEIHVEAFDSREAAVDGATDIARRFSDGEFDYRSAYQLPRDDYFEKLDELTGREP